MGRRTGALLFLKYVILRKSDLLHSPMCLLSPFFIPLPSLPLQVPFGNTKYDEGERFDLRLPYVDEGYVDESASLGNTLKRLFGFGKESKPTTLPQGPGSDGPGAARGKGKSGYGGGKKK